MNKETTPTESSKKIFIVYCETAEKISFENEKISISIGKGESCFLEAGFIELDFTSQIPENTTPENVYLIYSESEKRPIYEGDTLIIPTGNSTLKFVEIQSDYIIKLFREYVAAEKKGEQNG